MINSESKGFVLRGDRLTLRDFRQEDLQIFYEYRSDKDLLEFQDFILNSKEEALEFFEKQQKINLGSKEDWKQLAIADLNDDLIGDCAVKLDPYQEKIVEIGITVRKEYHKQGYAYEGLSLLIDYLFREMHIHKIQAEIDSRNFASQALFEKLGFSKEAHLKEHYFDARYGKWFDEYLYALLSHEYIRSDN